MKSTQPYTYIALLITIIFSCGLLSCHSSKKSSNNHNIIKEYIKHSESLKASKLQHEIADEAITWVGTPYVYAKCDKGIGTDCSGLVMKVYEDITGVKIPRNSAKQAEFCRRLKTDDVEIGDLVFFATGSDPNRISHVGIMIDSVNFVHSSTKKGVVISRIDTPYYIRTFMMFGRVEPKEAE